MGERHEGERVREVPRDRYREDHRRGEPRPPSAYRKLFPGFRDVVAEKYARLRREEVPRAGPARDGRTVGTLPSRAIPAPAGGEPDGDASPPTGTPGEGLVGPYRLLEEIGRGGTGVVDLAEDTRLRRRVALTVLPPRGGGDSPALLTGLAGIGLLFLRLHDPGGVPSPLLPVPGGKPPDPGGASG